MTNDSPRKGILIVVSGPSGSGKTTLCRNAREAHGLYYTVSCTTRSMRPGEMNGQDYHFLSMEDFQARVAKGEFLEHACVYGRYYGTLRSEVLPHLHAGRDVIMDLDTQGAALLRAFPDKEIQASLVDIFILPPNREEFRQRLSDRSTETPEQLALRLKNADEEMTHWQEYTYSILSGTREQDLASISAIILAERQRSARRTLG